MKKYLLTWYGITDLRASLGFESSSGPVLAALISDEYDEVFILGYTDETKIVEQQNRNGLSQEELSNARQWSKMEEFEFVSVHSNTINAHEHFITWLQKELKDAGKNTTITFSPVLLKHLNDTEGIYGAAIEAINLAVSREDDKVLTLYLSPGTPVMAFVWSLASLKYPNTKKRLIASPQSNEQPKEILLPSEWLEWNGRQVRTDDVMGESFDVVFHLFGEQRIPSLLGVNQFSSGKHVFLSTAKYPAEIMKQFTGNAKFEEIMVDPYEPEDIRKKILLSISDMPGYPRIGFNLTGGTKLMYAGALAACRILNATPFYFNSKSNEVLFLNDFRREKIEEIDSVEKFIKLNTNNLTITKKGSKDENPDIFNEKRVELTNLLWSQRNKLTRVYKQLAEFNNEFVTFKVTEGRIKLELRDDKSVYVKIGEEEFEFDYWADFGKYITGGWFEEYVYLKLLPLAESGRIKDLRIGLEVSVKETSDGKSMNLREQLKSIFRNKYQELDVTFTDGIHLYIIECKAGRISSDYVMKLENINRYFGGVEGRAIMVACMMPNDSIIDKKIKESRNMQLISGEEIFSEVSRMIRPGRK